jgi:hypothetical protein
MAIGLHTEGSWVAANATTQTVTLPTHSTGDMLIVRAGMKHATLPGDITCGTAGWARIDQHNNGTTASGNGTGDVQIAAFWKVATSASETNPVITYHASVAATPSCAVATSISPTAGKAFVTPLADAGSIAAATSYSATMGSHIAATAGDFLIGFAVTNDNTTLTVPTFTQTGITFAAVVESPAAALSSATSNDIAADGCYRIANSGTSSAAAVFTGTNSVADVGAAMVIRLREEDPPAVTGTGAVSLPATTTDGTGAEIFTATGASTLAAATVEGAGAEVFTATGAATLAASTVEGSGLEEFTATGAATLAASTVDGTGEHTGGEVAPEGTGAVSLAATTVTGSGELGLTATGAAALAAMTVSGTGAIVLTGTGAAALAAMTTSGTGLIILTGSGAVSLPAVTVAGDGTHTGPVAPTATGAVVLPAQMVAGSGVHTANATGTGAVALSASTVAGDGLHIQNATGTGAVALPVLAVVGTGTSVLTGQDPVETSIGDSRRGSATLGDTALAATLGDSAPAATLGDGARDTATSSDA